MRAELVVVLLLRGAEIARWPRNKRGPELRLPVDVCTLPDCGRDALPEPPDDPQHETAPSIGPERIWPRGVRQLPGIPVCEEPREHIATGTRTRRDSLSGRAACA